MLTRDRNPSPGSHLSMRHSRSLASAFLRTAARLTRPMPLPMGEVNGDCGRTDSTKVVIVQFGVRTGSVMRFIASASWLGSQRTSRVCDMASTTVEDTPILVI